jgi:hypothetical protein
MFMTTRPKKIQIWYDTRNNETCFGVKYLKTDTEHLITTNDHMTTLWRQDENGCWDHLIKNDEYETQIRDCSGKLHNTLFKLALDGKCTTWIIKYNFVTIGDNTHPLEDLPLKLCLGIDKFILGSTENEQ